MGLFLQTAILPHCGEEKARLAVEALAQADQDLCLEASGCRFFPCDKGVQILFNENCCGYDALAKGLSEKTGLAVMLLYIYDEDFWGYFFYENGTELDRFTPMPDYFGNAPDGPDASGNCALIASRFEIPEETAAAYLFPWTDEDMEGERKAFDDDEFCVGDCWQMADFMSKLGWPYQS